MGQRGPKPRLQRGTAKSGKRVRRGKPERPRELTGEAGREWDRISGELDSIGTLAVVDRGVLAAYCLAVADLLAAREAINREGRIVTVPIQSAKGGVVGERKVAHPAVKMLENASARISKLAPDLCLSPASRSRLESEQADTEASVNKVQELRERIAANRAKPV